MGLRSRNKMNGDGDGDAPAAASSLRGEPSSSFYHRWSIECVLNVFCLIGHTINVCFLRFRCAAAVSKSYKSTIGPDVPEVRWSSLRNEIPFLQA
jgi:hypothetical protein